MAEGIDWDKFTGGLVADFEAGLQLNEEANNRLPKAKTLKKPSNNELIQLQREKDPRFNFDILIVFIVYNYERQDCFKYKEALEKRFKVAMWDEPRHKDFRYTKVYISGVSMQECESAVNHLHKLTNGEIRFLKPCKSTENYCGNCLEKNPNHGTNSCNLCSFCMMYQHHYTLCPELPESLRKKLKPKEETLVKNLDQYRWKGTIQLKAGEDWKVCKICERNIAPHAFHARDMQICSRLCLANLKKKNQMYHGVSGGPSTAKRAPYFNERAPSYKEFGLDCEKITGLSKTEAYFVVVKGKPNLSIPQADAAAYYIKDCFHHVKKPSEHCLPKDKIESIKNGVELAFVKEQLKKLFTDRYQSKRLYTWAGIDDLQSLGITVQELNAWGTKHIDLQLFFVEQSQSQRKLKLCYAVFAYFGKVMGDFEKNKHIHESHECEKDARYTLLLGRQIFQDKANNVPLKTYDEIVEICKAAGHHKEQPKLPKNKVQKERF